MRALAGANSKTEVVRDALRLYEWYLTVVKAKGAELQVHEPETGKVRGIELFF